MIASHAAVLFVGYLAFFIAVVTGLLFLIQERRLKLKSPKLFASPAIPLEVLDRANLLSLIVGFALFTFGAFQGLLLARHNWGAYFTADPKEIWSGLTWGAYATLLVLRLARGFRGRRMILLSVMSFILVIFTFVGVNYLVGGKHVFF